MKVLYITLENLSLHKGSAVHIREVVSGLRRLGHEVGVMACSCGRFDEANHSYNLYRFSGTRNQPHLISAVFLFIYLPRVLHKYDVIYARDYHTVILALLSRIIFKKKLVFEINGLASEEQRLRSDSVPNQILSLLVGRAEKAATKYSDRIVSVTPQIASHLMRHFHCPPGKVEIIGNGVNTEIFRPIRDEASLLNWKQRLGINQEEIVIAFVGNLAPWQGLEYLIQVAPALLLRMKNIKFMIIGDGILKEDLEREVRRLELSRHFLFTGMVSHDQIPLYINISDICVTLKKRLKSGYSPLKLYEYMACGKPVIASRVDGLEFIEAGGAGRLVEPGDLGGLKEALLELLADSQKRAEMGQKGLQIVRDRFSWENATIKIEKLLNRLA